MYCLSQFCCLCFRTKVKLQLLHEVTCGYTIFTEILNVVIPEIQLSEVSHVMSVCENCVNFVTEMHTFRQNCAKNNFLLVEYIELLSSFGGEIGNARVEISDVLAKNAQNIKKECENPVSIDLPEVYFNDRPLECKVEVNDDFNDQYGCKEEINDDQLEVLPVELVHSPALQRDSSSTSLTEEDLLEYLEHSENNELYKCKICESSLKSITTFKRHVITQHEKKKHKCETCGKTYTRIYDFRVHQSIHTSDKLYQCEKCDKFFPHSTYLKRHMLVHIEKQTRCDKCGKYFHGPIALKVHTRTHDREEPQKEQYKCAICGKIFAQLASLQTHNMFYVGVTPHMCSICGKTFHLSTQLKKHKLNHLKNKPYRCDMCEKTFTMKEYLTRHKLTHSQLKQFRCSICDTSFSRREHVRRHEMKLHP